MEKTILKMTADVVYESMEWVHVSQNSVQWRVLVSTAVKLWAP